MQRGNAGDSQSHGALEALRQDAAEALHQGASKDSLRRRFRRLRRAALDGASPGLRATAAAALPPLLPAGTWLGLYWPVGSEPDLDPWAPGGLAERLCRVGGEPIVRLALPVVLPPRPGEPCGRLIYRPWQSGSALCPDACGIPAPLPADGSEPAALPAAALGLLLVPALAVDRRGIRLGSGGGWYDRLRADPAWRAIPALAVLPSACVVDRLPADAWDVPFSGWLEERGLGSAQAGGLPQPGA